MLNDQGQHHPSSAEPILSLLQHPQAHWKAVGIAQLPRDSNGNLRLPKALVTTMKSLIGHVPV